MATPPSRFVIVPHRPRDLRRIAVFGAVWLASIVLALWLSGLWTGEGRDLRDELHAARSEMAEQSARIARLEQEATTLRRSDQVSRDALKQVQQDLAARDEEIAGLRADVSFYERLVGGSAQRKGLTVHSVRFEPGADGVTHFRLTLTQTIKKAGTTRGGATLRIEGVQDGALHALEWAELRQESGDAPLPFEFRYFQRLEGSVMLPAGFRPHRVQVRLQRESGAIEQTIPWEDTQGQ